MQIYDWHAVQAILIKFRSISHKTLEIEGGTDKEGREIVRLKELA